ncbi:DUF4166 domain-containing protein [Agromyces humatus]|uniref:DUF4166 domain-containing protein n=1 Tax=Agromyces humatus TaxID=279573 RepID=A0ABP4X538_9MICO|nr:DUF4166 domain-containing protein [Agromyces humatus]
MTSIFQRALGEDFARLHPMMQRRFGVGLDSREACIGTGMMTSIRRGPWWTVPFLQVGRLRNILIPDVGRDVPFRIENFPYRDPLGRETITFVREYDIRGRRRRFDATMILVGDRVVDYLGTHQHLAVDLDLTVDEDGSMILTSDAQRFYDGPLAFRFPIGLRALPSDLAPERPPVCSSWAGPRIRTCHDAKMPPRRVSPRLRRVLPNRTSV